MKKNIGFTVIEIVGVLAIVSLIIFMTAKMMLPMNNVTKATKLATQSLGYAKMSNRYINNHYQDILSQTATTPVIISWSQITQEIKSPLMPARNIIGQIPCVYITQSGKQIQPYLYFVTPTDGKSQTPTADLALNTMMKIGPQGGFVQNNNVYGLYKGWQYPASPLVPNLCGGSSVPTNTTVINLGMMQDLHVQLASDTTLHRPQDQTSAPGASNNGNTLLTTVDFANIDEYTRVDQPHRMIFNNNNKVGLQAANSYYEPDPVKARRQPTSLTALGAQNNLLVVRSGSIESSDTKNTLDQGGFAAGTLLATLQVDQGAACSTDQIGATAVIKPNSTNTIIRGQAQCTRNPVYCGNKPCWLQINSYSVIFSRPLADYSVDCAQMVAPGFHIVPGSVQYVQGPSPDAFGNRANSCCHWAPDGANYSTGNVSDGISGFLKYYIQSADYGLSVLQGEKIVQKWGAFKNGSLECQFTDCGNQYSYAPVLITSVTCSNDTSDFEYNVVNN